MSLVKSPKEIVDEAEASDSQGLLVRHPSWPRRVVRDFATVQNGSPFASSLFSQDGKGFPLIRIRDVGKNRISTYFEGEYSKEYVVRAGDLLIGMDGDFRSSRWQGPDALLNQRVCRLVVDAEVINPVFVEYALQGYLDAICAATSSITVKHLSSRTIQDIPLPIPPLAEQQRIVEILEEQFSRLDAALASIRTVREKAAAFRRSLLQATFGGEFSEKPNGEWKVEPLSNIAELSLGVMLDRAKDTGEGQVPYLANINVRWGTFETDKLKTMQVLPNQVDRATVRFGDVVVCEGGEPGRCAIWRGENGIAIQKALHRVRPMGDLISTYLCYFFEFRFRGVQSDELFTGTTIRHLPKEKLATLEIPLPSVGEQRHIVEILEEQFSRLNAALEETNQLEARIASERRSLLHAAFSGALTEQWRTTHNG